MTRYQLKTPHMMRGKMSRARKTKINQLLQSADQAITPEQQSEIYASFGELSWDEMRELVAAIDRRDYDSAPRMLTFLVNLNTEQDLNGFREEFPDFKHETNENILRLRDELRAVWGAAETEHDEVLSSPRNPLERAVTGWFSEFLWDKWDQSRWLLIPQLGLFRPANNLAGSVARAMFQWHEYCFTCSNPACNGTRYVARRKDQKYCLLTEECAKYGHRAAARRYSNKVSHKQ